MGNTIFDMSVSLDGYVTAAGISAEEPLGTGGERLHEWALGGDPRRPLSHHRGGAPRFPGAPVAPAPGGRAR